MKRATIIATLAFLAGAAASYYGVPRPVVEKVVTAVAERVIPKETEQTQDGLIVNILGGPPSEITITCEGPDKVVTRAGVGSVEIPNGCGGGATGSPRVRSPVTVYLGHAPATELGRYPDGCKSDGFRVKCWYAGGSTQTFGYPTSPPRQTRDPHAALDAAYYRALAREGLHPVTEHR